MAKLTSKERKKIPGKEFALPGRRYPIEDKAHARNAKARVAQHGSPAEKKKVDAAVARKYPGMGKDSTGKKRGMKLKMHHGEHEGHKAIGSHKGYIKLK